MNRTILAFIATVGILLAAAAPAPLQAQNWPDTRTIAFSVNLGYINLTDYPKWITLGPEVELRLGRHFSVNPEASIWMRQSRGGTVQIVPGRDGEPPFRTLLFRGRGGPARLRLVRRAQADGSCPSSRSASAPARPG